MLDLWLFFFFWQGVWNCDEVKQSGQRLSEVMKSCRRFWKLWGLYKPFCPAQWPCCPCTVLNSLPWSSLLSFRLPSSLGSLTHFPPVLLQILPPWQQQRALGEAGWGRQTGDLLWESAALTHPQCLALEHRLLPWAVWPYSTQPWLLLDRVSHRTCHRSSTSGSRVFPHHNCHIF